MSDILHQAMVELAARCDGALERDDQGFSKPDSFRGKYLAAVASSEWSPAMTYAAYQMAHKYQKQLVEYGVDFASIEEPEAVADEDIARRLVDFRNGRFVVEFAYDPALVAAVKLIPGRQWDGYSKTWSVPASSRQALEVFMAAHGFLPTRAVVDALAHASEAPPPMPDPWLIDFRDGLFLVCFPKEAADFREDLKAHVDGRRWDGERTCWTVPHYSGRLLAMMYPASVSLHDEEFEVTSAAQAAFESAPNPWRVELDGELFRIYFPFDAEISEAVKRISGRRFVERPQPHWSAPVSSALELARFLRGYGPLADPLFEVSAAAKAAMAQAAETQQTNLETSRAADADEAIVVPGLSGELRPFQRGGVQYAMRNRRTFIADEMGLGKTLEALAAVQALDAYPAVIVCPASLKLNWANEARKWLPDRTVEVIYSDRVALHIADITIINYDILADGWEDKKKRVVSLSAHAEALKARGIQALVLDEAHACKSRDAQRTAACKALAQDVGVRLLLTGTPVLNRPEELLSQLDIMGRLGDMGGFWHFAKRYCDAHETRFGWDMSGATNLDELNQKLRATCMIRRRKEDVLHELPPKQRIQVMVDITNRTAYTQAAEDLMSYLRQEAQQEAEFLASIVHLPADEQEQAKARRAASATAKASRAEHLVRINKLKQLAAEGKMTAVIEWVENFLESGEKLVLFAHHVAIVRRLAKHFKAPSISGETPVQDRQAAVDRFQSDPDCRLIVGNLQAMGVGLTLTAASNVATVELGWTPALHDQADDRVHRIGQVGQRVSAWYILAQGTIEEQIAALIERKRQVVDAATEGGVVVDETNMVEELVRLLLAQEDV